MLKVMQNKGTPSAPAAPPPCQRLHKQRIRRTCEDCRLFIPGAVHA